jgi:formate hydrogenlyase subunit 3/multisubunit Na+/H+ antiporter MnhD subunit
MTLKRIVNWIVGLPVAIVAVAFAVANREWIRVSFDPVSRDQPFASITMPLWALFFAGIFVGLFAGWVAAWLGQSKHRKAAREARIELARAQLDHERFKRESESNSRTPTVPAIDS